MTRPSPAALAFARSTLPVKRVASPNSKVAPGFAALLQKATAKQAAPVFHAPNVPVAPAPAPGIMPRSQIIANAEQLMGIPYVWGGVNPTGFDCSAFVSKVWGVSRQTTDTLGSVSHPISKEELKAGDALNLTTGRDPEGDGHVRLFDKWANAEHTKMYVYEETPPRSVHHVINWDPSYQPMRLNDVSDA